MPEHMGKKIFRAEESARIAYRRSLGKAVRAACKGSGWRSVDGSLFREHDGWFVSVRPSVHIFERATTASISAKPMSIDPIFWDIVGLPENNNAPLSFRLNGAWACHPPPVDEAAIEEHEDACVVAARIIKWANNRMAHLGEELSVEGFLQRCRTSGATQDSFLACVVATLISMSRQQEALDAVSSAKTRRGHGGFGTPEGDFTDMATRWIGAFIA